MVFDPFKDFATAGYLRNWAQEKDIGIVKCVEHALCRANLPDAIKYLRRQKKIEYRHFLKVHCILFQGLYPWVGKDHSSTDPDRDVVELLYLCRLKSQFLGISMQRQTA